MQYLPTPLTEVTDSDLVQRALANDQDAFEALVNRYYSSIHNFAYGYLGDYDYAHDVSQHVFLKLYLSLSKIQTHLIASCEEKTIKAWLFRVAWHRCIDEIRRKKSILFSEIYAGESEYNWSFIEEFPDTDPLPEEIAEQRDLLRQLTQAIQSLPARYRSVVFLRCTRQMTFEEIGKTLNMRVGTAKVFFSRARPLLQTELLSALHPSQ